MKCSTSLLTFNVSCLSLQLQDYALGRMEYKTNLGYVMRGCETSAVTTHFTATGKANKLILTINIITIFGIFFQIVFVWIVSAVLLKMTFKEYAQKTFTYTYDMYGMFWGISTSAVVLLGIQYGLFASLFENHVRRMTSITTGWPRVYNLLGVLLLILVVELPVAIYTARKAKVAVPGIFKYPAALLCCGRRRRAEHFVTAIALWVDLVALQLILLQGSVAVFAISAAPFAIASNVMLIVLAFFCLANIFSLLFTIFAHLCTGSQSDQHVDSRSMVLRAVVVLPLLFMIMCYGFVIAAMGSVINRDAKDSTLSFIKSITNPILLGIVIIFLKRFISAWLKWSPQAADNGTDRQEADGELIDP